jgi:hypothetical protein
LATAKASAPFALLAWAPSLEALACTGVDPQNEHAACRGFVVDGRRLLLRAL